MSVLVPSTDEEVRAFDRKASRETIDRDARYLLKLMAPNDRMQGLVITRTYVPFEQLVKAQVAKEVLELSGNGAVLVTEWRMPGRIPVQHTWAPSGVYGESAVRLSDTGDVVESVPMFKWVPGHFCEQ